MITIFDDGGVLNAPPVITELQLVGEPTQTSAEISYKVSDADKQIVRHYITIPGLYDKKEITKEVGYEKDIYTYKITGLTKNTTYSVVITCSDGLAKANSDALQIKTKNAILYSFTINEADSNPATRVSYGDEAVGVSPATSNSLGGWEDKWPFNVIRLVGLQNGKVTKEVSKTNRTQYTDGSPVPSYSSKGDPNTAVDVMTEFPTIYWRKSVPSSGQIKFEISDNPIVGGDCYAHKVGGVVRDKIYVGCFLSNTTQASDGGLFMRSVAYPNVISTSFSLYDARRVAKAYRKTGYWILNFNILTMLQILFTLAYRNTNSQSALGKGYTEARDVEGPGRTANKNWVYGSQNGTEHMCFLGIEDLWGNLYQWVDGIKTGNKYDIQVCTDNVHFDDTSTGWENVGTFGITGGGYLSAINKSASTGFFPNGKTASASTYYCDYMGLDVNSFAFCGGWWNAGNSPGVFNFNAIISASTTRSDLGARLVYIGEVTA